MRIVAKHLQIGTASVEVKVERGAANGYRAEVALIVLLWVRGDAATLHSSSGGIDNVSWGLGTNLGVFVVGLQHLDRAVLVGLACSDLLDLESAASDQLCWSGNGEGSGGHQGRRSNE